MFTTSGFFAGLPFRHLLWPRLLGFFFLFLTMPVFSQTVSDTLTPLLIGRWEVLTYAEQGVSVDKKQAAKPQAMAVYEHIRRERAERWYGYSEYDYYSRRESRDFERWTAIDSVQETNRVAQAIAMPYFAVFFTDSTVSLYNKEDVTNYIYFPEVKHYVLSPASRSMDVYPVNTPFDRWQVQILLLTATRMRLFLPQDAEVVDLIRTAFFLP